MMRYLLFLLLLSYSISWAAMQDPTAPPGAIQGLANTASINSLKLEAIFNSLDSKNRTAIINGTSLHEGEKISDIIVLTISADTVTVKNDLGETRVLHLFHPLLKPSNKQGS